MIKEQKIEGVGLLKGVVELTNAVVGKGLSEKEATMELSVGGKLEGGKCPYCGAESVYFTDYISPGAPNLRCASCNMEWVESPEAKLHIREEVMMEDHKVPKSVEARETLVKLIPLANPEKLPESFSENCLRIWEAWNLGRDYERLMGEEE